MVKLSTASGIGDVDVSAVFDELGPSASSANEFATDPNCVALWRFENGALTTDSIGTNTLTDYNTVGTSTSDYKEGSACAEFNDDNNELLYTADTNLDSDFPLKSGASSIKFSICGWFNPSSTPYFSIFSKKDSSGSSFDIKSLSTNKILSYIYTDIGGVELLYDSGDVLAIGRWYHVAFTFDNSDKSWKFIVWDDTAQSKIVNTSGTATNNIGTGSAPFCVGGTFSSGSPYQNGAFDGLIDEVVVFKDILTTDEIDTIRQGSYNNRKKIAVTTDDGTTQCYVEIEKWDDANEEAWLHVKVPSVAYDADTVLYLYYDSAQSDNTTYIGDTTDAVTHNVWDSNFAAVYHMAQDPNGDAASAIKDSTSNANDGTPAGSMTTADLVSGKTGDAIDFDGIDDYINVSESTDFDFGTGDYTTEAIFKSNSLTNYARLISLGYPKCIPLRFKDNDIGTYLNSDAFYISGANLNDDVFHHVCISADRDGNAVIYNNGGVYGSSDISGKSGFDIDVDGLGIAADPGGGDYLYACIDEVRISNIARSASWIKATYNSLWDSLITFSTGATTTTSSSSTTTTTTV